MYSHLSCNDTTGGLDFADTSGWFRAATIAPLAGSYASYGKDGASPWVQVETDAGSFRLTGVAWTLHDGAPPLDTATNRYLAVSGNAYITVAAADAVDSVYAFQHESSFDNFYGNGTKPKFSDVIGKHPIDLLSPFAKERIDGTDFADVIRLNDQGSQAFSNGGKDSVTGGIGDDRIDGGKGNDTVSGGGGQDTIFGNVAKDRLFGDGDNDHLYGGSGKDELHGGLGQDDLAGDAADDSLFGDGDNDRLDGGDGDDVLKGGIGQDRLAGDAGADKLFGEDDNDELYGSGGNDRLYGGVGQDLLSGDGGKDALFGDADNDTLNGRAGTDKLLGGIGQDRLFGGAGEDKLKGEDDNDRLDGGAGDDVLSGGAGANQFVFTAALGKTNRDKIADFKVGADSIELSAATFAKLAAGPLPESDFHRGARAHDADDHILYAPRSGVLIYDANGDKKGGSVVFAKLADHLPLSHTDFLVI